MANTPPFSFDQVGIWSELKLEIVEKYGSAYTGAFSKQPRLKNSMSMHSAAPASIFLGAVVDKSTVAPLAR
jgi:hypothetical protein